MSSSGRRALLVLDEVARSDRPLGVTEIARALSLPPGTVFRSLDALLRAGLVGRYRASARFVPGPAAEQLHRNIITRFPARELCLPYLRQLVSISGETTSLHMRIGWYAVRICSVPGTDEVMTLPPAGEVHALGESCAGHAILAFLPKAEIAAYRAWEKKRAPQGRPPPGAEGAVLGFPVRLGGHAAAAITIQRPESAGQLSTCKKVIANIEMLASAQPSLFANPFAHLDPDLIIL